MSKCRRTLRNYPCLSIFNIQQNHLNWSRWFLWWRCWGLVIFALSTLFFKFVLHFQRQYHKFTREKRKVNFEQKIWIFVQTLTWLFSRCTFTQGSLQPVTLSRLNMNMDGWMDGSRLPCYVFCICMLTNKYQKYKSVELGDQLGVSGHIIFLFRGSKYPKMAKKAHKYSFSVPKKKLLGGGGQLWKTSWNTPFKTLERSAVFKIERERGVRLIPRLLSRFEYQNSYGRKSLKTW